MSKYFLSVCAMFKNEGHVLKEWLDHYLAEGVEHFYLIENNSTDNWSEVIRPYLDKGLISLFVERRDYYQVQAYNQYIMPVKDESEWMLICDLDEFAFSRNGTLASHIRNVIHRSPVNAIIMPWIVYGSSGHTRQPSSVIGGFRKRRFHVPATMVETKSIVRTRDLIHMHIHVQGVNGWVAVDGAMRPCVNSHIMNVDEDYAQNSVFVMNHYRIQSRNWYYDVKRPRGDAVAHNNLIRDEKHFKDNDWNDVGDDTLARKRGLNAPVESFLSLPETEKAAFSIPKKKTYLSVCAIFKNEADIIPEWIEHYLAEGVEHFYLIENNSSDDWQRALAPYRARGLVTLFVEKGEQAQFRAYNEYILPIKETEWMIVVDLDEFVYARPGHTIAGYLQSMPGHVGNVQLPWILFGSSGYDRQPEGVVQNFLWRKFYMGSWELHKTIIRMSQVEKMGIHDHTFKEGVVGASGGNQMLPHLGGSGVTEERIAGDILRLNHYQIQSRNRYLRLKTGRGDAVFPENYRSIDTYRQNAMQQGSTKDVTLANKRRVDGKAVAA